MREAFLGVREHSEFVNVRFWEIDGERVKDGEELVMGEMVA